jgi:dual specificity MAP kinase phosphatase
MRRLYKGRQSIEENVMTLVDLLTLLTQMVLFILILSLVFRTGPITLGLRVVDQSVRNLSGTPIPYLSRITPQLYVGGQHSQRGWMRLQAIGITAIVNMRETQHDDSAKGIAPERYLHLPTVDGTPPSMEHLRAGIEFIQSEIASGGKVYIHCASGIHRAPTMATAYFISTGLSVSEALAMVKKVRPFARPDSSQTKQLELLASEFAKPAPELTPMS